MQAKRIIIKNLFDGAVLFNQENCDFRVYENYNQGFTETNLIVNEQLNVHSLKIVTSQRLSLDFVGYIYKYENKTVSAVRVGVYVFI